MKKTIRNLFILICLLTLTLCFTSCKPKKTLQQKIADGDMINVAIIQYVYAPPLDNAREGIIKALSDEGFVKGETITLDIYNCNGDMTNVNQSVTSAISRSDVIFAIATPVAQVIRQQFEKKGIEIPTFFTAVTDPVDSDILDSSSSPNGSITGTSDLNQVAKQIEILKELRPNAKKVGFIYSSGENNSIIQMNLAKDACEKLGFELVAQSVTSSSEFKMVTQSLINKGIDALYLPTDNSLASNAKTVINLTNLNHIPTLAGESAFLESGATICYGSVDYSILGEMTGKMAILVMRGEKKVSEMPVQNFTSSGIDVNKKAADEAGIEIPKSILDVANIK